MTKINHEVYAKTIKYLMSNDATLKKLSEEINLNIITVGKLIRVFRKHKLIHVCDWENDKLGRDQIMVIRWGDGKDLKRFKMSAKERQRLHRARKKAQTITHPTSLLKPLSAGL